MVGARPGSATTQPFIPQRSARCSPPLELLARLSLARRCQAARSPSAAAPRVGAVAMGGAFSKSAPPPPAARPGAGTFDDIQKSFSEAQRGTDPVGSVPTPPLRAARRRWRFSIFGPSSRRQETSLSGKQQKPPKPLKEGGSLAMRGREVRSCPDRPPPSPPPPPHHHHHNPTTATAPAPLPHLASRPHAHLPRSPHAGQGGRADSVTRPGGAER